jgi:hypothetical protein
MASTFLRSFVPSAGILFIFCSFLVLGGAFDAVVFNARQDRYF